MKPRTIDGLEPDMALADAAALIVAVRTAELFSFGQAALHDHDGDALHDLRIAAKRLRYVLELVGFCLGDGARDAASHVRDLQTVIGEIHDCDVLLARVSRTAVKHRKGLARLAERLRARREERFIRFTVVWSAIEASGLKVRILAATNHSPESGPRAA